MTAIDPVCGMEVEESTAQWKTTYEGKAYYFCSPGCLRSFTKEPAKYLAAPAAPGEHEHDHSHDEHGHEHSHGEHSHEHSHGDEHGHSH
jgi:YHS domain-containing protein